MLLGMQLAQGPSFVSVEGEWVGGARMCNTVPELKGELMSMLGAYMNEQCFLQPGWF